VRKNFVITIRLPDSLKRRLEIRARRQRRSLSSQLVHDLEAIANESSQPGVAGRFLGLFASSRVPTDKEIREVRAILWGSLGTRRIRDE
jgi:hypothetical protein